MRHLKLLLIAPIAALCTVIAIPSGLLEILFATIGAAAYRVQCIVIDWAERRKEG